MGEVPHRPFLVVVSAPSGAGKTTICRKALTWLAGLRFSVSHTTRPRRAGEVAGQDYHFVGAAEFDRLVAADAFLEWAHVYGNRYGTSRAEVERARNDGVDLLVEIDVQGAEQILQREPDAVGVFILPPSLAALERRLRARGTDSDEQVDVRLRVSRSELACASLYGYWIVNDDVDAAVAGLVAVIRAERLRRERLLLGRYPLADSVTAG